MNNNYLDLIIVLTDIQAALGTSQLKKLDEVQKK